MSFRMIILLLCILYNTYMYLKLKTQQIFEKTIPTFCKEFTWNI